MGFNKIRMGKEEIFETIVMDIDGRIIDSWKVMKSDYPNVVRILFEKYGIRFSVKGKSDLDWAI